MKQKYLCLALVVMIIVLLLGEAVTLFNYGNLKIHVAFANDQTRFFDERRVIAVQSGAQGAVGDLGQIMDYYPSGTKQMAGSRLDLIVERERAGAIREVVNHLRTKTGEDLGNDPAKWIAKYGSQK